MKLGLIGLGRIGQLQLDSLRTVDEVEALTVADADTACAGAVAAHARPPHVGFLPTSGGLFRDCGIHDFDVIRWVTGREVVSVYGIGANRGDTCFSEAGDVDTAAALLRLDDDTSPP